MARISNEAREWVDKTLSHFDEDGNNAGNYKLEQCVGQGHTAAVYRARGPEGIVGVKLNFDSKFSKNLLEGAAINEELTLTALNDALLTPRLEHLVRGFGLKEDTQRGVSFAVMEYVPYDPQNLAGEPAITLQRLLLEEPATFHQPDRALNLLRSLLEALSIVHAGDYVHGDVAPRNVLVTKDGLVKLSDFGFTKKKDSLADPADPYAQLIYGKKTSGGPRDIAPPELAAAYELGKDGAKVPRTCSMDLWQLANLFTRVIGDEIPLYPSQLFGDAFKKLDSFLQRALKSDITLRPLHAKAMLDEFEEAVRGIGQTGQRGPAPTPTPPQPSPYDRAYREISDYVANDANLETADGVTRLTGLVNRAYDGATDAQKRDVFALVDPAATEALKRLNGTVSGLETELGTASTALSTARDDSILKRLLGIKSKAEPHLGIAGAYRELAKVFPRDVYSERDQAVYAKLFPEGGR